MLKNKINEVLEYYDYCLIGVKGDASENKIYTNFPTTVGILYRDLTIQFGAERVSKTKGMVKVLQDEK